MRGAWLLAALSAIACSSSEGTGTRPNVLLISIDSTCKDLVGAYGRDPQHAPGISPSPNLDRLAEEGVLFEDVSSTTSWTLPSHLSMLTGLPALVHAVDIDMQTPDQSIETLAEALSETGYRTGGFFSGPYLDPRFGFAAGFERYEACFGQELAAATSASDAAQKQMAAAQARNDSVAVDAARRALEEASQKIEVLSHRDVSSESVTDQGLEFLAADDGRPWFLFLHYFDAHYDYTPPAPFDTRFDPGYEGSIDGHDFISRPDISVPLEGDPFRVEQQISTRDLEHIYALYEGELAWTDQQIGRVLARIDELGLKEDTLVIVTSDHGDEFFEHDGLGHRKTLYEEVLQVPLLMRYPGTFEAGRRVETPVSILSIVPTVLDVLDIPSASPFTTRSLAGMAKGRDAKEDEGFLARLVYTLPATQGYSVGGQPRQVSVLRVFLTETYRKGPIKVYRRRYWTEFRREQAMPPQVLESLETRQRNEKATELVSWVDLAKHPGESERYFSKDFSNPEARAALQEFHDLYPKLMAQRRAAGETNVEDMEASLTPLGYTSGPAPDRATEAFEVPPPGLELLRTK